MSGKGINHKSPNPLVSSDNDEGLFEFTENTEEDKSKIVPSPLKFGFLGIGGMGSRLVRNLLKSGHKVSIWNRTLEKCEELKEAGADVLGSPLDVVTASDITFSCVENEDAVKAIVFDEFGVLAGLNPNKAYVEMSGISSDASNAIHEAIYTVGGRYLEGRLQGTYKSAQEGTLTILACGDRRLMQDCASCFCAWGKTVVFIGNEIGKAANLHSVLQSMLGVSIGAAAECMALARASGTNLNEITNVLEVSPLNCSFLIEKWKAALLKIKETDMTLKYLKNDVRLALDLADRHDHVLRVTPIAYDLLKVTHGIVNENADVVATFEGAQT